MFIHFRAVDPDFNVDSATGVKFDLGVYCSSMKSSALFFSPVRGRMFSKSPKTKRYDGVVNSYFLSYQCLKLSLSFPPGFYLWRSSGELGRTVGARCTWAANCSILRRATCPRPAEQREIRKRHTAAVSSFPDRERVEKRNGGNRTQQGSPPSPLVIAFRLLPFAPINTLYCRCAKTQPSYHRLSRFPDFPQRT